MTDPDEVIRAAEEVTGIVESRGVGALVIGAVALAAHGYVRFTEDLALGDTWIAVAWSGDIAQLQADNPGLEWVIPSEGGMLWVDNAMIPVGAKNPEGANKLLNYVYDPAIAGPLYESIQYIPPVTGAEQYMSATAKASRTYIPLE